MNKRYLQRQKAFLMGVSSRLARSLLSSTIKHNVKCIKLCKKMKVKQLGRECGLDA